MDKFRKLRLSEDLLQALKEMHISEPTEIQEKAIPLVLEGKDVLGGSATGSGKTLAFGAGVVEKVRRGEGIQALIMTPTRELAEQVAGSLEKFAKYTRMNIVKIYGGVDINPQIRNLKKADVVVGTPGRLLDHLERRTIDLTKVRFLVLDEADRMLEMGFVDDVMRIVDCCPKKRQTLLFSATISPDIKELSNMYLRDPVSVSVESLVDPKKLVQYFYDVPSHLKFSLLVHLLNHEKAKLVMVFCNTRSNVDLVVRNLKKHKIESLAIHGGLAQNKRSSVMKEFHSSSFLVLVCTDVAARGLDVKGVSHVYNFDIPKTSTDYIHRVGRTARAGKEGLAISLVSSRDYENFNNVSENESLDIEQKYMPKIEQLRVDFHVERKKFGGRSGSGNRRSGGGYGARGGGKDRSGSKGKGQGGIHSGSRRRKSSQGGSRRRY